MCCGKFKTTSFSLFLGGPAKNAEWDAFKGKFTNYDFLSLVIRLLSSTFLPVLQK